MRCPSCDALESKVLETRTAAEGRTIRRRRQCSGCELRFTTSEQIDSSIAVVIGRDGHRSQFSRKTLVDSLMLAGRSSLTEEAREDIANDCLAKLRDRGPTVTSMEIANALLEVLARRDTRTWLRYALVTQRPASLSDFEQWLADHPLEDDARTSVPTALVQKRDGSIEAFAPQKLERALQHASRGRALSNSECRQIARNVEAQALREASDTGAPVQTRSIGEWVESELVASDPVAALSFALLFRNIDSTPAVLAEVHRLARPHVEERKVKQ